LLINWVKVKSNRRS